MIYCTGCLSVGCSTLSTSIPSDTGWRAFFFSNGEVHIDRLLAVSIGEIVQGPSPPPRTVDVEENQRCNRTSLSGFPTVKSLCTVHNMNRFLCCTHTYIATLQPQHDSNINLYQLTLMHTTQDILGTFLVATTLIKKKTKSSIYIRKFRWDWVRKVFLLYEKMHKYFHRIWGGR